MSRNESYKGLRYISVFLMCFTFIGCSEFGESYTYQLEGERYLQDGRYQDALRSFQLSSDAATGISRPTALQNLASMQIRFNQFPQAIVTLQSAVAAKDGNYYQSAGLYLVALMIKMGDIDGADQILGGAVGKVDLSSSNQAWSIGDADLINSSSSTSMGTQSWGTYYRAVKMRKGDRAALAKLEQHDAIIRQIDTPSENRCNHLMSTGEPYFNCMIERRVNLARALQRAGLKEFSAPYLTQASLYRTIIKGLQDAAEKEARAEVASSDETTSGADVAMAILGGLRGMSIGQRPAIRSGGGRFSPTPFTTTGSQPAQRSCDASIHTIDGMRAQCACKGWSFNTTQRSDHVVAGCSSPDGRLGQSCPYLPSGNVHPVLACSMR